MIALWILSLTLAVPASWVWGHCTARIVYRPIGADAHRDELQLNHHERAQFRDIEDRFDGTEWRDTA
ncbi:hypothetical protein ACIRQH_34850 [Streptomyces sp. NPDC102279]|uniref:hypothetical protein n=1 Tax=Streptomyces sp. NPDC102279 TaxID=3366153 RepID=UPI0037FCEC22